MLSIASLQFSICTGGLLSALLVVLANASTPTTTMAYMSSAQQETFLCAFATSVVTQSTDHVVATEVAQQPIASGCTSGEACIQQGGVHREERLLVPGTVAALPTPFKLVQPLLRLVTPSPKTTLAFNSHLKHTMVKQE